MQRTIVESADLSGEALADLKSWLGISRPDEDALLVDLLRASIALCEAFTGQAPLMQTVEERLPVTRCRTGLRARPVQTLVSAELVAQDGLRSPLDTNDYAFAIEDAQAASFELKRAFEGQAVAVQVTAGIAADWFTLPGAIKQGVIRMAAHHHRDRDRDTAGSRRTPPPASVAALWRPWRLLRLT